MGGFKNPWSVAILPDGDFLVSERRGRLWLVSDGNKTEIRGLPPIAAVGQGGLLDIEPSADFATTRRLFFSYSTRAARRGEFTTAIAKATLRGTMLTNMTTIFVANNSHASGIHFGSRISELTDGTLVFSVGDRGRRHDAQNGALHAGSILRIDANGRAPRDNPFVNNSAYAPEIFTVGHRNIQGMAVDARGNLFTHEHGPRGGDELNRIISGKNYGWPAVTYGKEYRTNKQIGVRHPVAGYESPLRYWIPSIAPSGMMVYSGKKFPRWSGNIFVGALAAKRISRLTYTNGSIAREEKLLHNEFGRIRDIKEDKDGFIYFITDESRGALYRIAP